ncbi:hypothetical protein GCM10025859_34760 [Alicyclobacillus fastidiosus]|nr:hypothetical protein GCM10025859_34760 [Alicyclobacillus fastidiosus]
MVVQEWNASSTSCHGRTNGDAVRSEPVISTNWVSVARMYKERPYYNPRNAGLSLRFWDLK